MKSVLILTLFSVSILSSCSTPKQEESKTMPAPKYRFLTPNEKNSTIADYSGNRVRRSDINFIRTGEDIKGYTFNPYTDGFDPSYRYSGGEVMRVEQSSKWINNPTLPQVSAVQGLSHSDINTQTYSFQDDVSNSHRIAALAIKLKERKAIIEKEWQDLKQTQAQIIEFKEGITQLKEQVESQKSENELLKEQNELLKIRIERILKDDSAKAKKKQSLYK